MSRFGFCLTGMLLVSCHESKEEVSPVRTTEARVIGFDPCGAGTGLVLALSIPGDTVATFNFPPEPYSFPPALFQGYSLTFLFPPSYQNSYRVLIKYRPAESSELQYSLCTNNINTADYRRATKGRQIVILEAQKAN